MPNPRRIKRYQLLEKIETTEVKVTSTDVQKAWKESSGRKMDCMCLDRFFYAQTPEVWDHVLQYSSVNNKKYVSDRFDCDDFAFALKGTMGQKLSIGSSIGVIVDYSGKHAYNALLVTDDNKLSIQFLEPQQDTFVTRGSRMSSTEMYKMTRGYVIF